MSVNWAAVFASLLPNIGGWVNAIIYRSSFDGWYKTLKKPSWTPPSYIFMPVWTCLYTGMGYASYLVWRDAGRSSLTLPLTLYMVQLLLNWAWSEIFFGRHNLKMSFWEIVLLDLTVLACVPEFYKLNPVAGWLMVPYLGWLLFETALNYRIYKDNPVPAAWKK